MNLKKASLLLIIGLVYTVFYKAIIGFIPFAANNIFLKNILSVLLLISALSIILFIFYFYKEVTPLNPKVKITLQLIFFCTCILIILKLPIELQPQNRIIRNSIFEIARILNSFSILMFFIFSNKIITIKFIRQPIKLAILGFSISLILNLISLGYYLNFILTGNEGVPFLPFRFLAMIIFLFTYYVVIDFLIKFRRVDDYSKILGG
ncbi:MAG: hypothetical protein P8Z35_08285 [Ignavibacteriaceae bacterium]